MISLPQPTIKSPVAVAKCLHAATRLVTRENNNRHCPITLKDSARRLSLPYPIRCFQILILILASMPKCYKF